MNRKHFYYDKLYTSFYIGHLFAMNMWNITKCQKALIIQSLCIATKVFLVSLALSGNMENKTRDM